MMNEGSTKLHCQEGKKMTVTYLGNTAILLLVESQRENQDHCVDYHCD